MVRVFSLLNRMRKSSTGNPFFVRLWSVGRMRKKSANLRESRSLRSLNESRARIVARRPFGSAWLIATATAHAGGGRDTLTHLPHAELFCFMKLPSVRRRGGDCDPRSGEQSKVAKRRARPKGLRLRYLRRSFPHPSHPPIQPETEI